MGRKKWGFFLTAADEPSLSEAIYRFCSLNSISDFKNYSGQIDFEPVKFGCKYVWGDEFNTNSLDNTKWAFGNDMGARPNLTLSEDEEVLKLVNGTLELSTVKTGTKTINNKIYNTYKATKAINTKGNMNFRYGYVEMRAKVPHGDKAWPAFWTKSTSGMIADKVNDYSTEVDIVEVISSKTSVGSHIHKWNLSGTNRLGSSDETLGNIIKYDFGSQTEAEEYHTYGFKWTETSLSFYVDGYMFYEVNSAEMDRIGISDFVDPMYLILNNHLYSTSGKPTEYDGNGTSFIIDYVRLYQNTEDSSQLVK